MRLRLCAAILVAGCGPSTQQTGNDLSIPPTDLDMHSPLDAPRSDFSVPDLASPDLASPSDLSVPPDQPLPDLALPDLSQPDLGVLADLVSMNDFTDLAMPDLAPPPDLKPPADLAPPPDLKPPADLAPPADFTKCTQLKINEVQTASLAAADDEFVELYNACPSDIDLTSYKLVYRSTNNNESTFHTFNGVVIPAGGFLVIAHDNYVGFADVRYGPNVSMSATAAAVGIRDTQMNLLDSVSWGALAVPNAFTETTPTVAPAKSKSIERLPDGTDTGDNSKDFAEGNAPTPKAINKP